MLAIQSTSAPGDPLPGFHRLSPQSTVRGSFLTALVVTLVWCAFTGFLTFGPPSQKSGDSAAPVWLLGIFGVISLLLIFWTVKSFLRWTLTGQTTVDVSSATAVPGEPIEIIVAQPGQFIIDQCNVELICQESATYTAGTDTETKTEIVRTIPICDIGNVTARNGQMLTRQTIVIPADAMLSFDARNNKITWMIRVKMVIPKRPDSQQLFPLRVLTRQIVELEGKNNG